MKKIALLLIPLMAFYVLFPAAEAATTDYSDSVVSSSQGLQNDGDPVIPARSDPNAATGTPNGVFFSLGFGGQIMLEFPFKVHGNLSVAVQEITGGAYPLEQAAVEVSDDGFDWLFIGTSTNEGGVEDALTELSVPDGQCVQFVRLIDATDPQIHNADADAFDVDAVSITYDELCPEEEPGCCGGDDGDDTVKNDNHAYVYNDIKVIANTGKNDAGGSYGGDGGNGGDINPGEGGEVENSTTSAGGIGGNSAEGGTVITGDASSSATVLNDVNLNDTSINRCCTTTVAAPADCCVEDEGNTRVINRSSAKVKNRATVVANTGKNDAHGSKAGDGGNGGDIGENGFHFPPILELSEVNGDSNGDDDEGGEVEESTTGAGGNGGVSGPGGLVQTGRSDTRLDIMNFVNHNITRILR